MSKKNQLTTTDYLAWPEYIKLTECLHKDHDVLGETYARVAVSTALRISDVLRLTWDMVLNRDHFIITEKKTRKTKRVDISDKNSKKYEELYALNGCPDTKELIFVNRRSGKAYTKQYIDRLMKDWKEKYNIEVGNFSSHSFRKTFGRFVYNSMPNKTDAVIKLQGIFNHSNPQITLRYIGVRQEEITGIYGMIEA